MDLTHDWKALNEVLFQARAGSLAPKAQQSSLILIEDGGAVIDGVLSTGAAFEDRAAAAQTKSHLDSLAAKYGTEQTIVLSQKTLDQLVVEVGAIGPNYFQQLQTLRSKVVEQLDSKQSQFILSRRHFVLDLFSSHLRHLLPRRFNVLLMVDQRLSPSEGHEVRVPIRSILLTYTQGELDQFFEPDFSSLHEDRIFNWQSDSNEIGQYLESRYMLPCFGVFVHRKAWGACLEAAAARKHPWAVFVKQLDLGKAALYPRNLLTDTLLAAQRIMVYFGRV